MQIAMDAGENRSARHSSALGITAKLNGVEPQAYLRDVITRIGAHPVNRLHQLLPWNMRRWRRTASPPEQDAVKRNVPQSWADAYASPIAITSSAKAGQKSRSGISRLFRGL